jgi:hypothetical protein
MTVKAKEIYSMQKGTSQALKGDSSHVLEDNQIVNHFYKHSFITSKVGLTQSLKNLHLWSNEQSMEHFYPKCFVLSKTMVNAIEGEDY